MPIYMDVHIVPGVKARDVAEAHRKDLLHQDEHNCKCMTYWIDEQRENIFCLIEAPTKEAVEEMHRNAHGLIPNKIIEVSNSLVESFLGRIYDPANAEVDREGLKVFHDPSFRILLVTKITDPALLKKNYGAEKTNALLSAHKEIVRQCIANHEGREAEHRGTGFIASFDSAAKALSCAIAIQNQINSGVANDLGFRIALNGGEPIESSNKLFGDTIQFAGYLCGITGKDQIGIGAAIKELLARDQYEYKSDNFLSLSPQDEETLKQLVKKLDENWQDADFDTTTFGKAMAMSQSQLYRKSIQLTGHSPNSLIKNYRLDRAKEMLSRQRNNISQVTFDSGFTSPSYFTKCFKKKFGLLPLEYIDLLH